MTGRRYPREPLAQLRTDQVEESRRKVASAVKTSEEVRTGRARAERELDAFTASAREKAANESRAFERGELRVEDLERGRTWAVRVAEETRQLQAVVSSWRQREADAVAAEVSSRGELVARIAELELVERDRNRWVVAEAKAADRREEDVLDEMWRKKG